MLRSSTLWVVRQRKKVVCIDCWLSMCMRCMPPQTCEEQVALRRWSLAVALQAWQTYLS